MDSPLRLDVVPEDHARETLARCCGSRRWVERMMARRPFGSMDALLAAAREEWFALPESDWRDAFRHHPMIGDREALAQRFGASGALSGGEQAGLDGSPRDLLDALAEANRAYVERFGYIFIVCATGLTGREMLSGLRQRLSNDPRSEILIAAGEQAKITELRLRNHT